MGLIRKTLSVTTLGAVDFRSDKERTAAYTRGARRQARKQTKLLRRQNTLARHANYMAAVPPQPAVYAPPALPPAGWYPAPVNPALVQFWDGQQWLGVPVPPA